MGTEPTHAVEHDFASEGPEELSCDEGDLVAEIQNTNVDSAEGWTLVLRVKSALIRDPTSLEDNSGFVPTAYLRPLSEQEKQQNREHRASLSASTRPQQQKQSSSPASAPITVNHDSSPRGTSRNFNNTQSSWGSSPLRSSALRGTQAAADSPFFTPSVNVDDSQKPRQSPEETNALENTGGSRLSLSGGANIDQSLSNEYRHLFASQEDWYQQVNSRRKAAFQSIERSLDSLNSRIVKTDEKSSSVIDKLKELDVLIDEERRRWQDRLDEEQQYLTDDGGAEATAA